MVYYNHSLYRNPLSKTSLFHRFAVQHVPYQLYFKIIINAIWGRTFFGTLLRIGYDSPCWGRPQMALVPIHPIPCRVCRVWSVHPLG